MKKLFVLLLPLCLFIGTVNAEEIIGIGTVGYINASGVDFNSLPNLEVDDLLYTLDTGDKITVTGASVKSTVDVCETSFYKVSYYWEAYNQKTYYGYVCGDNIVTSKDLTEYEAKISSKFPESYKFSLALLLSAHPSWTFTPKEIKINFSDVVLAESIGGKNSIQSTNPIYLSLDYYYDLDTGKYISTETGGWYAANSKTVAYYMDPRNFLDEVHIFMFENLINYVPELHTIEVVDNIVKGTGLEDYSSTFISAAIIKAANITVSNEDGLDKSISPVFLASRSKQEVTTWDDDLKKLILSDSAAGKTASTDDATLYYNFFNIAAYSSSANPVASALSYAQGKGWSTPELAIKGGASFLYNSYIGSAQYTTYFQKFNVATTLTSLYNHQYMANIQAPMSEASITYNAYKEKLDNSFEFVIPVYLNMPTESRLPTTVDQEKIDKMKDVESPDLSLLDIPNIIAEAGYRLNGETISKFITNSTVATVKSKFNIADETVVIKRGSAILKDTDIVSTGDTIIITKGTDELSLKVIVYGDASGNGDVDVLDLLKVQKHILASNTLSGDSATAADVNKDSKIDVLDLLKIQKDILGVNEIDQ